MVSIHALLAECDRFRRPVPCPVCCFNPRTPCGVRLFSLFRVVPRWMFQSTHSLRSATSRSARAGATSKVSIHALLAECDRRLWRRQGPSCRFNPRTPCGVRQVPHAVTHCVVMFQSTHSLRSATPVAYTQVPRTGVSIHALLAECDAVYLIAPSLRSSFNPRTPCGVRQAYRPAPS